MSLLGACGGSSAKDATPAPVTEAIPAAAAGVPTDKEIDLIVDITAKQAEAGGASVDRKCLKKLLSDKKLTAEAQAAAQSGDQEKVAESAQRTAKCIKLKG